MERKSGFNELDAAEGFIQVARGGSFTHAAKSLGKSASTLSRAVMDLEALLGVQLLVRTTRRLHMTEAGALYLMHAEGLLAARRAAHDAVTELTGGIARGHLRVSMPVSVGERLLGPHLPEFRRRYPELRLEVDLSDRNVPLVQGGFDLAIRVGRLADSSLKAQLIGRVPMRLVASPDYLVQHGAPTRPRDIAAHACLSIGPLAGPAEWTFYKKGKVERVVFEGVVHTTSPTLGAQLACAGLGLVRASAWVVAGELRSGSLVEVMTDWSCDEPGERDADGNLQVGVPVYVLFAQGAGTTPPLKSRVFVELIREIVAREVMPAVGKPKRDARESVTPAQQKSRDSRRRP